MKKHFDHIISSGLIISEPEVNNLTELIFNNISHRNENSTVILSHDGSQLVSISLKRLRHIVSSLFPEFSKRNIHPGDTILLASITGNNELYIALMFIALACYGAKVLLPMFLETEELLEWLEVTECHTVIIPGKEIMSLNHHDNEKSIIRNIMETTSEIKLACYDIFDDFKLRDYLYKRIRKPSFDSNSWLEASINNTDLSTECLYITTSGSSGKSKLVLYEQGAFIRCCMSWLQAGFYDKDKLGGRGFTPLFTHTMGIRAFFNALWTGVPVCLINTEWFTEKPETVRYLLMQMKPEHITGGPSVYNLLLELMRNFPELKDTLPMFMKTLVTSGADITPKNKNEIESALNCKLHNAFGTTETQQAISTLMIENGVSNEQNSLGLPLPGVKLGLKKVDGAAKLYRLYIQSRFGMKQVANSTHGHSSHNYFDTGDLVEFKDNNQIVYIGRENKDFIKDGFGVKLPLNTIKLYYHKLFGLAEEIDYLPLRNKQGLAALIFIDNQNIPMGLVTEKTLLCRFSGLIAEINNNLFKTLEPFEFNHRTISRFVLVNAKAPRTLKGNLSKYKISLLYHDIIEKLIDTMSYDEAIKEVEGIIGLTHQYTRHHNPLIGQMLAALGMDYTYHKGLKDSLYTYNNGEEIEVLDFTGGYGTNLLGHNHPEIKRAAGEFLNKNEVAISDQGSIQKYMGMLASQLSLKVGKHTGQCYNVIFGSTGSEAVEIALHHAYFEWRKNIDRIKQQQYQLFGNQAGKLLDEVWQQNYQIISNAKIHVVALKHGFHGNSSGARSLLGNCKKREAFSNILPISSIFIDDTSPDWKKTLEESKEKNIIELKKITYQRGICKPAKFRLSSIIASITEPIIGEGGVRITNREMMKELSQCDFPLIMDEIQCGLGRTGTFLASEGIKANYYLFAKSLGGNIEKISAVLIDKNHYKDSFGEYYISTFATGGLAAKIAIKTLSIIQEDKLAEKAGKQGRLIRNRLNALQKKYPGVIAEITGKGLMQGIQFRNLSGDTNLFLRTLFTHKISGLLFACYLLKKHNIRILPTTSASHILRVEPSAYITNHEIERFIKALDDLLYLVQNKQIYQLLKPLMDNDPFEDKKAIGPPKHSIQTELEKPGKDAVKVAFIAHYAYPVEELRLIEKDFYQASDTGLRILFNRLEILMQMKPFVLFSKNLYGGRIHFSFIVLPLDSAELERLNRQNKRLKVLSKIQQAVDLSNRMGAKVVSLGAYTSILSNNGLSLRESRGTKIITGNTLTAASGIQRLLGELNNRDAFRKDNTIGIVGASGNIGSIITEILLKSKIQLSKAYLIGRNENKLRKTFGQILQDKSSKTSLEFSSDLKSLKACNIIVVVSNTNDPIIYPGHLASDRQIIISDLSVPHAVSSDATVLKHVIHIPFASYVTLNQDPEFMISSHTPQGTVFCCAAEAILCGLEEINLELKGKLSIHAINALTRLANKHRFFDDMGEIRTYKTSL